MTDLLVVGGGIIGLATAWRAARAGLDVMVLDPAPGRGASHVAAGMLAPVTEVAHGQQHRLALDVAAARRWPSFARELEAAAGVDLGYRSTGTLLVGFDRDDTAVLDDLHALHRDLGLAVQPLRGREARAREPMLSPRVRAGLLSEDDHRVEPRAVVAALLRVLTDLGVDVRDGRVARLDRAGDRAADGVVGATTVAGETHRAAWTVLATGSWSGDLGGLPDDTRPPVRPVKGQLLHLRDPGGDPVLRTTVRGLVRHRSIYLVPRDDGRLVVGGTQEERGFDVTVTAGGVRQLLDDAVAIVPGVDELELTETIAGLRPTTPDNAPVVGRSRLDGLLVATGHHRGGVLLAPITADTITALATGGEPDPVVAAAAAPDRDALARR